MAPPTGVACNIHFLSRFCVFICCLSIFLNMLVLMQMFLMEGGNTQFAKIPCYVLTSCLACGLCVHCSRG